MDLVPGSFPNVSEAQQASKVCFILTFCKYGNEGQMDKHVCVCVGGGSVPVAPAELASWMYLFTRIKEERDMQA